MKPLFLPSTLLFVPLVAAHGYVSVLGVDGTPYDGQEPTEDGQATTPSVIRRISTKGHALEFSVKSGLPGSPVGSGCAAASISVPQPITDQQKHHIIQ